MKERNRKAKRSERIVTLARRTLATIAIITLILAIGYIGEQDRQYELMVEHAEKVNK